MKKTPCKQKKNACNNKIEENEDKARIKNNRHSQLNDTLGDNEEVVQVL